MHIEPVFPLQQDALSQVLDLLRLRGTSVMAGSMAHQQTATFEGVNPCIYVVQEGSLLVSARGRKNRVTANAGDVVLFVRGARHDVSARQAVFLRGEFTYDTISAKRFLRDLPETIVLKPPQGKPFAWVDISCAFILDEAAHGLAGAASMISRLLDLLFVRTLRTWASESGARHGWLAGAVDERIGRVLTAMHQHFAREWNLPLLAELAPMSRTAFANRFRSLVGVTPMAYLNAWRLDRAAEMLRHPEISVTDVAMKVGYGSNAAFSRAFKVRHGRSPMRWRQAHRFAP